MEKSSIIGTAAVIIGALMTLVSFIFLRDTDFYAVRWIGVVIMVAGFSCGPAHTISKHKTNMKRNPVTFTGFLSYLHFISLHNATPQIVCNA